MRRPILKNSNKKLKGNISLLVILILLASSVIGLLSINQIQRLITYGNMTFNYFRAFYLAKAWTELGLTEVYYREAGFNHEIKNEKDDDENITKYHSIIQNNFLWEKLEDWDTRKYEAFNPYFEMTISWSFANLTNDVRNSECEGNEIVLGTWEWIMISLFSDNTQDLKDMFTWTIDKNLPPLKNITDLKMDWDVSNAKFTFWLFSYKKNNEWQEYMDNVVVKDNQTSLSNFFHDDNAETIINDKSTTKKYLTIKNSWESDVEFCISWDWPIPSSDSLITVRGNYGDMEIWLQSVVKKWVPDWALNVLWEPTSN